jgi:hypothetical protein
MRGGKSLKPIILAGALLAGAATVYALSGDDQKTVRQPREEAEIDRVQALPGKSSRVAGGESSRLKREIRVLTSRKVRAQLPEGGLPRGTERTDLLFWRLGALEGEEALDHILSRYGKGSNTGRAMAMAIAGWMEVDPKAALAAFDEFADTANTNLFACGLTWNGTMIVSGIG